MGNSNPVGAVAAGILLFVAGLVVGVWTLEQARSEQDRLATAGRAEGTVTGEINGHPLVTFTLPGGDRITFTASVGRDDYHVGAKADVLYRLDRPSEAVVDRPRARWARTALLGALSLTVTALGAYIAWYARSYDLHQRSR